MGRRSTVESAKLGHNFQTRSVDGTVAIIPLPEIIERQGTLIWHVFVHKMATILIYHELVFALHLANH